MTIGRSDNWFVIEGITENQLENDFMELQKRIAHWIINDGRHVEK